MLPLKVIVDLEVMPILIVAIAVAILELFVNRQTDKKKIYVNEIFGKYKN